VIGILVDLFVLFMDYFVLFNDIHTITEEGFTHS